jgi:hypothetical protein
VPTVSDSIHRDCSRVGFALLSPPYVAVMAALVPAIHVLAAVESNKTWMPATSAGMTVRGNERRIAAGLWPLTLSAPDQYHRCNQEMNCHNREVPP